MDDRSLGQCAVSADVIFGYHKDPKPSYSFPCGHSILAMFEAYSKADKLGVTGLLAAASVGHTKIVERLLARGADFEARTLEGATPLMIAAIANDAESINMLLLEGADVNATAKKGQTALMLASWSDGGDLWTGRTAAVRLLLNSGADANAQDAAGRSALMGAAEANNLIAAKFLLSWS
ncbi:MAG TPA: ankyrin repeat domain-containing protein [Blastocatellia bacterium]|nr:ankyrin repeat domain-containing protein [Blastocatellia bacterium]